MPKYLWEYIAQTANMLRMCTPSAKAPHTTPYFKWHGTTPSVAQFHIVGTECYYHDPDYQSVSLNESAEIVRYLGTADYSRSLYYVYRPSTVERFLLHRMSDSLSRH